MRVWLSCFLVLFAIAELFQWLKHLALPLPIHILGGAFLAIVSNYNKHTGFFFQDSFAEPPSELGGYSPNLDNLNQSQSNPVPEQPPRAISFTIKRSGEQNSS